MPPKTAEPFSRSRHDRNDTRQALAKRADVSRHKIDQATAVKRHDDEHGTTLLKAVKEGDMDLKTAAAAAAAKSAANAFGVMSVKTA